MQIITESFNAANLLIHWQQKYDDDTNNNNNGNENSNNNDSNAIITPPITAVTAVSRLSHKATLEGTKGKIKDVKRRGNICKVSVSFSRSLRCFLFLWLPDADILHGGDGAWRVQPYLPPQLPSRKVTEPATPVRTTWLLISVSISTSDRWRFFSSAILYILTGCHCMGIEEPRLISRLNKWIDEYNR